MGVRDDNNEALKKKYTAGFEWDSQRLKIGRLLAKGGMTQSKIASETGSTLSFVGSVKRAMDLGIQLPPEEAPKQKGPKPAEPKVLKEANQVIEGLGEPIEPKPGSPAAKQTSPPPASAKKDTSPPVDSTKPLSPEDKAWHKSNGDQEEGVEEPDENDAPSNKAKNNGNGKKEKIEVGNLYEKRETILVSVDNIFWYHYSVNEAGYKGTFSDFANECIRECAAARGLKLTVTKTGINQTEVGK